MRTEDDETDAPTASPAGDCTDQVLAIYGGDVDNIPADTLVVVNMNWEALQYVGKSKAVFAEYDSGIASICFTNMDESLFPDWVDLVAPYSWETRYPYPTERFSGSTPGTGSSPPGRFTSSCPPSAA